MKESESSSIVFDPLGLHGLCSPWNSPGQNTGGGSLFLLQAIFPTQKPRSPALRADSLPAELQEKPNNTGVGSLSLLQGIFPTQESNWGLLHCKQTLYQLSYEESLLPLPNSASCGTNIHNPPSYRRSSSCKPLPEALPDIQGPPRSSGATILNCMFPGSVFSSHPDSCSVIVKPWVAFSFISCWSWFSLAKCLPWQVQGKHL